MKKTIRLRDTTIDPTELFPIKFRVNATEYEHLALVSAMKNVSMQKSFEEKMFTRDWRAHTDRLRGIMKKLGYKWYEFLPPALLARAKIKIKERKRRRINIEAGG